MFPTVRVYCCKRLPSYWSRAGLHQDHPVVRLSPCWKWPNTQRNGCMITSMVDTSLQTRNKEASLLHTWHWVLFCLLSSMKNPLFRFWRHLMSWSDIVENVSKNKYVLPHLKISKRYINVYLLYMALQAAIKYFHMFRIGLLLTLCSKGCRLTWRRNITDLM